MNAAVDYQSLPMQPMANLPTWLQMAAQLYMPKEVALVGAGNGTGPVVQALLALQAMPRFASLQAHALEAHAPTLAQLAKRLGPNTTWQLSADAVFSAHVEGSPTYHHYSLGTESSLLPPSDLQTLWPNLQLMSEQSGSGGVSINRLLPSPWLLLDCLPAATLLQGADLRHTYVLVARVVLGAADASPTGSTLAQLQAQLTPQGYQLAACFVERNSQLAKTLWLLDPAWLQHQEKAEAQQQLNKLKQAHEAQAKSSAQDLQALQVAINEAKQASAQLLAKLDAEVQAKTALQAQLQAQAQDSEAQKIQAAALTAELSKANEEERARIRSLQADLLQANAQAEHVAAEHVKQLDAEKSLAKKQLTELAQAHEAQAKSMAQELQALQATNSEAKQANAQLQVKLDAQAQAKTALQAQLQAQAQDSEAQKIQAAALTAELSKAYEQAQAQLKDLQSKQESLLTELRLLKAQNQKQLHLFEVQLSMGSKDQTPITFNSKSEAIYKNKLGQVKFDLPANTPAYLVCNETGDFERAPTSNQLKLQPNKAYEFTGTVKTDGGAEPVVWLFEYDDKQQKIKSHSFPTSKGECRALIKTQPNASAFAIGIRLVGVGLFDPQHTRFQFENTLAIEVAEALQPDGSALDKKLEEVQAKLQKQQQTQSQNSLRQIESFLRLQSYCGDSIVLPEMHGWPVSPDVGVQLIRLVESGQYDAVIEFGSGVSTLLIALAIQKISSGNVTVTAGLSFEHLENYLAITAQQLAQAQLNHRVQLVHAPLVETPGAHGQTTLYYDCAPALQQLRQTLGKPNPRLLVFVDGPPAATGPYARYPAFNVIETAFEGCAEVHYLMDDYIRQDERDIVSLWEATLAQHNRNVEKQVFDKFEKQACLLFVKAKNP